MSSAVARRPHRRVGAFFDLDKTLIAENSGSLYVRHRYEQGEIGGAELLSGAVSYLQYKLGLLDIDSWTRSMMTALEGRTVSEFEADVARIDERMVAALYPEAIELVTEHLAQGHVVAIVSGATKYSVEPIARRLGIEHMLYTRLEIEEGRFTGRVVEPICFEEGKIYWLQHFIDTHDIDLARSWFYTDSITDMPLLELVGHPVAANPDPRLYREAVRRGWRVRLFEAP